MKRTLSDPKERKNRATYRKHTHRCTSLWGACRDVTMCLNLRLATLSATKVFLLVFKILFSSQCHPGHWCKPRWLLSPDAYVFFLAQSRDCWRHVWADAQRASVRPIHWSTTEQQEGGKRKYTTEYKKHTRRTHWQGCLRGSRQKGLRCAPLSLKKGHLNI